MLDSNENDMHDFVEQQQNIFSGFENNFRKEINNFLCIGILLAVSLYIFRQKCCFQHKQKLDS